MKNELNTSNNYKMLFFVAIINIFMAMSLNSFSSSDSFLPALFLYFISNLATFLEKASTYKEIASKWERRISYVCFFVSLFIVCGYLAHELHFIEINFPQNYDTYRILIQGIPNSFITFSSIDITVVVLICTWCIPIASILLALIPYLRNRGFTQETIYEILTKNPKLCFLNFFISFILGLLGVVYCHMKSYYANSPLGHPQYWKYFFVVGVSSLL